MKKKVLHIYPALNCGGTEMVFYNLIKFGDRDAFEFHVLVQRKGDNEQIFNDINCPIHRLPFTDKTQYRSALINFFRDNHIDVVHAHMDGKLPFVLSAAKEAGIKCRVAHSHNARVDIPQILWPLFFFRHHPFEKYATDIVGCSSSAIRWLFPLRYRLGKVVYNGIDLDKFKYDAQVRNEMRKNYGISDSTKVFINVGRCTEQKNQTFILNLAKERSEQNEIFVIIGEGPLLENLRKEKQDNHLENVWIMGKRTDVADWLCMADCFLFPSIYEGLGIVAIEAEACGLQVIATETIPEEVDMQMGNFYKIDLNSKDNWHTLMSLPCLSNTERETFSKTAFSSHYNIRSVTKFVESIYNSRL